MSSNFSMPTTSTARASCWDSPGTHDPNDPDPKPQQIRPEAPLPPAPPSRDELTVHARMVAWYGSRLVIELGEDETAQMLGEELTEAGMGELARKAAHHGRKVLAAIEAGRTR